MPFKAYPTQSKITRPNRMESNKSTKPQTMQSMKQYKQFPSKAIPYNPKVMSHSQSNPIWFVLLKGLIVCMLDLIDLIGWLYWFGMIDVIALLVWTAWLDWYDRLCWLLGMVRWPWLCLDGIIGFIGFGCIALVCFDWIRLIGFNWIG